MASLFDSASLLFVASAYKQAKAYSSIPTNGDGDFVFARADTSTRTTSDGTEGVSVAINTPALDYGTAASLETCPSYKVEASTDVATLTLSDIVANGILTGDSGTLMIEGDLPDDETGFFSLELSSNPNDNRIRTTNTGFVVKQSGSVVSTDNNIFTSESGKVSNRIAVSWSGAGAEASHTPTLLFSQGGATKTSTLDEWSDDTFFDRIVITGQKSDDTDRIKAIAIWNSALSQSELNTITS